MLLLPAPAAKMAPDVISIEEALPVSATPVAESSTKELIAAGVVIAAVEV